MAEEIPELSQDEKAKSVSQIFRDAFNELKETTLAFIHAPKALWGINVPYILEGLVYFGILTILGKYSSENLGLADDQSSLVYSALTGGITFAMLLLGGFSDKIGVRKSLILAFFAMVVGRVLVAFSGSLNLASGLWSPMFNVMAIGLLIMVLGYGLYQPASYAGIKRYTNKQTAAMGYAVLYGFMNLGAFLSGFVSSLTRPHFVSVFPPNGLTAVFWAYAGITVISLLFTVFILTRKTDENAVAKVARENAEFEKKGVKIEKSDKKDGLKNLKINNYPLLIYSVLAVLFFFLSDFGIKNSINIVFDIKIFGADLTIDVAFILSVIMVVVAITEYLRKRPYHPFRDKRFSYFIFILIPVQTLFAHNWLTLPYYLNRAFEGSVVSRYFEVFSNINPILIFFLAPFVAGLTARVNIYKMMIYGTLVMALPTFLLSFGPNVTLFLSYILIMTIGEAMWQPRFLQWIAEVAPEGKTGLYMGVGQFPWFLTKVVTGFYSGIFLMKYCPINTLPSEMHTGTMWFIYGLIAIMSPIGLVLAKNWMLKGFKEKHNG